MGYDRHVVNDSMARHACVKGRRNKNKQIENKEKTVPVIESVGMRCRVYETNSESGNACRTSKLLIVYLLFVFDRYCCNC